MPEPSLFQRTVAVRGLGDGRYSAELREEWQGPAAPNGGILAATLLRAAQAELGPDAPPARTVAAHFLEAPAAGPAQLDVEVLRMGKRVRAAEVRLRQSERLAATATIIFSAARDQAATLTRAPHPPLPDPDGLPELPLGALRGAPPVFDAVRMRPALGPQPFSRGAQAITGGWLALRDDDAPLDAARLCAMTDLWWPAVFGVIDFRAGVPTIQLTVHLRLTERTVAPPVFARFETRVIAEAHLEESGELWSADGELLAESLQLALLPALR
jgi:acyl-CoA thioesterase